MTVCTSSVTLPHLAMRGAPARAIEELAGQGRVDDAALHAPEPGIARCRDLEQPEGLPQVGQAVQTLGTGWRRPVGSRNH